MIGSCADRYGRRYVVPIGFFWASVYAPFLAWHSTPLISAVILAALSVGFDATHPLMSSFTTSLDPEPRGQTVDNALMEYEKFLNFRPPPVFRCPGGPCRSPAGSAFAGTTPFPPADCSLIL